MAHCPDIDSPPTFTRDLSDSTFSAIAGRNAPDRVVLVEGFFDAIKVFEAGFAVVALMGATMSARQVELLSEHFSKIVLLLDGDNAGRCGTQRAQEMLAKRMQVLIAPLPDKRQPDKFEPYQLKELIDDVSN